MRASRSLVWVPFVVAFVVALAAVPGRAAASDLPAGYRVVNATELGRALFAQKAGVSSVRATLQSAFRDLTRLFGVRPTMKSAYEDLTDRRAGNATFIANVGGWPTKGVVFCRLGNKGANIAVLYGRTDMQPAEWNRLANTSAIAAAMPAPGLAQPASPARAASAAPSPPSGTPNTARGAPLPAPSHAHLRQYRFPDGTGTVGLADGWHTNAQSCMGGFSVQGPGDQLVMVGIPYSVVAPNSSLRSVSPLVAPFATPIESFRILVPQLSRLSMRNRGPRLEIDNLVQEQTAKAWGPNDRAAVVSFGVTETRAGGRKHFRAKAEIHMSPVLSDTWMMTSNTMRAPDATFVRDLPVMLQIVGSFRENAAVITQKSHQQINGKNHQFAQQQEQQREKSRTFDAYINDQERASNARMRQADNFDEVIRGTRTVEDTRTGEKASVDLGNVDQIVDGLNQQDSDRYRQIPLRDEADPVPAADP